MSSAIASGTAAVSLASLLSGRDTSPEHTALGTISLAAGVSELCLTGSYLATSGEVARPLREGWTGALFRGAAAATVAAITLDGAGMRLHSQQRLCSALAAGAVLAGSAMLRLAMVRAGRTSAVDRDANLVSMSPSARNPGWGPPAPGNSVS